MKRFLLALAFLAGVAPACAQQSISNLPQVATPADADLFLLDVQSFPLGQRTHSVSALGLTSYILGKIPLGPQGVPGQTGPATTLFSGTTTTGAPGTAAVVTVTGTAPVQYLNVTVPQGTAGPQGVAGVAGAAGPKGDPGATGAAGASGVTGAAGPTNTLSIGTVSTGTAGSSAGASITGSAPSQTLNLTIPTGPTGPAGPQGPAGASGSGSGNVSSSGTYTAGDFLLAGNGTGTATTDGGAPGAAAFKPLSFFLQSASNLSDLPSASSARSNLGLGTAATQAASAFLQAANSLSDLGSASSARINLGLGGAALLNIGTATGTVAAGDDSRIAGALQKSSNLADLTAPATARTNLGLGSLATQSAGGAAISGGTINSTAIGSTTPAAGVFTTLSATTPLPVTSGGTGSNTASVGLTNLGGVTTAQAASAAPVQSVAGRAGAVTLAVGDVSGAAKSGANTDITSLASPAIGSATATTQATGDSSTKIATDAFVAGAVASNGGGTEQTISGQDVRALYLTMASQAGADRVNGVNLVADGFNDASDVATLTGATYDGTNHRFALTPPISAVPNGTAIAGDANTNYPSANAFDGNLATGWATSSGSFGTTWWVGQDFGSAKSVTQFQITQGSASGFSAGNAVTSVYLEYSDTSPTSGYVLVGTYTLPADTATHAIPASQSAGAHRYWRVRAAVASNGGAGGSLWSVSELVFQTGSAAATGYTLQSVAFPSDIASPTKGRVLVQVDGTSATFTPNTDIIASVSRDGGTTFTAGTLAYVETLADGTKTYETGLTDISGQPAGSSMVWRVATANSKNIVVSGVVLQWRP